MEEKPNYYAIIPAEVRYNNNLRPNEKLLFGEITALSSFKGECTASNNYFSRLYGVVPSAITKWIKDLEKEQYITVDYIREGKEIKKRIIRLTGIHKYDKVFTNVVEGYSQKFKENNTSNNNTSINNNNSPETGQRIPYKEIIDHLNMRTNSKYRHTTDGTRTLIKARFNEGYTLEDFIMVIDKMCVYWTGNKKMEMYLRPSTLFNGKNFENYYNMKIPKLTTKVLKDNMDFSDF